MSIRRTVQQIAMALSSLVLVWNYSQAAGTPYSLDVSHSEVGFTVAHLVISKVKGHFKKFDGSFDFDETKGEVSKIIVNIDPASIDTNDSKRDDHLRASDFFDTQKYPTITFKADKALVKKGEKTKVSGILTMHGASKPVNLDLEYMGSVVDQMKNIRHAFSLTGKINRKDWGLSWNKTLDNGGLAIGEDVTLNIEGEIIKAVSKKSVATN